MKEDTQSHQKATIRGMVEGLVAGTVASSAGFYLLHRRSLYFRSLPPTIKALGFVMVIAPAVAAQAERRGEQYDREHNWGGEGERELDHEEAEAVKRWNSLTTTQRAQDWALRYRWHLFLAGWATTMGISWMILRRNKTQTFTQKIVQARVYAQGIALAGLLGGAALAQMHPSSEKKEQQADHSWARLIEQQAEEAREIERARAEHAASRTTAHA